MKTIALRLAPLAAFLCMSGAWAAGMSNSATVSRDYTDTVAPANQQAYEAGVKAYNQCLAQNGVKYRWTALTHETGNTYMYSYVTDPLTWADFDTMHTQDTPCDSVWMSKANPYLQSETSAFMVAMPEMSHMPKDGMAGAKLVQVMYFYLKPGPDAYNAFVGAAKQIAAAAAKSNWPGTFAFSQVQDGGDGSPDFILVWPGKSWADLNQDINPDLWKMVENVYGKKMGDDIRKTANDAIANTSSHVDAVNSDLTYTPSGN